MRARLDHVGLIVPDLDEAARVFTALGFTLTRRADHTRPGPDGVVVSAGSAQHSIMFGEDYIELQEITGPRGSHLLSAAQEKHFGLHILAFGVEDADTARREAADAGLAVGPVLRWGRPIDEAEKQGEARFGFFVADYHPQDEALYCWVEHLTLDLLRSPRLTDHPNGAVGLDGLRLLAADAASATVIARRLVAAGGLAESQKRIRFADRSFDVDTAGQRDARLPLPHVAELRLRVANPSRLAEAARRLGFPATSSHSRADIDMVDRYGIRLAAVSTAAAGGS